MSFNKDISHTDAEYVAYLKTVKDPYELLKLVADDMEYAVDGYYYSGYIEEVVAVMRSMAEEEQFWKND